MIVNIAQCKPHSDQGWHLVVHKLCPGQKQAGVAEVLVRLLLGSIPLKTIADIMLPEPAQFTERLQKSVLVLEESVTPCRVIAEAM